MSGPAHVVDALASHLLERIRAVQESLGVQPSVVVEAGARLADLLDSMGMAEYLILLARDCGVTVATLEECAAHNFSTVAALAEVMHRAGLSPRGSILQPPAAQPELVPALSQPWHTGWLAATAVRLPARVQTAEALAATLGRPAGWLRSRAGIAQRHVWGDEDPLAAAAAAGRECLESAGLLVEEVGALLVTSEAPPLPVGLAAALHGWLDLRPETVALDVGGACTGFLHALWLAQSLLGVRGVVQILTVEAPSRYLRVEPGPAGEAAALFGDGAAAAVVCDDRPSVGGTPLGRIVLGADASAAHLIQVAYSVQTGIRLHLTGGPLATRAIRIMAQAVRDLSNASGLALTDLVGVVAHGGNGRLPRLLARQLGLPPASIWSATSHTGNLGTASLPVAWHAQQPRPVGPVLWTAVGAGLSWGAALTL
jgi:3-oxoacyl-[acyl-carrier-protein] synthase-3